jgi:hypothetical protein
MITGSQFSCWACVHIPEMKSSTIVLSFAVCVDDQEWVCEGGIHSRFVLILSSAGLR